MLSKCNFIRVYIVRSVEQVRLQKKDKEIFIELLFLFYGVGVAGREQIRE